MAARPETQAVERTAQNSFLKSIGLSSLPATGPAQTRVWPDPLTSTVLGPGWAIGYQELIPGYPESQMYCRLRKGMQTLSIKVYVASDGPATAERRFLILGTFHQMAGPVYSAGPPGLGSVSAMLDAPSQSRLFWLDGNAVIDMQYFSLGQIEPGARIALADFARWFVAATRSLPSTIPAIVNAPLAARAASQSLRVGEITTIDVDAPQGAFVSVTHVPPFVQLIDAVGRTLTFRGLRSGRGNVPIVAIDPNTLLATTTDVSVEVQD